LAKVNFPRGLEDGTSQNRPHNVCFAYCSSLCLGPPEGLFSITAILKLETWACGTHTLFSMGECPQPCDESAGAGFGFRVSGFRSPVSIFEFRFSGFGIRFSGFRFWFSGFSFPVSGFGFRVSGFGFRASVFGFRVSGFGACRQRNRCCSRRFPLRAFEPFPQPSNGSKDASRRRSRPA